MKHIFHKIEIFVDKVIPICLILLLIIVIMEVVFTEFVNQHYFVNLVISLSDFLILMVFILDLIFKFIRVRTIPEFLKKYWLEIIAVLPFFLFFRLFEFMIGVADISRGVNALTIERSTKLLKYTKLLREIPRFLKSIPMMIHFYEEPLRKEKD